MLRVKLRGTAIAVGYNAVFRNAMPEVLKKIDK